MAVAVVFGVELGCRGARCLGWKGALWQRQRQWEGARVQVWGVQGIGVRGMMVVAGWVLDSGSAFLCTHARSRTCQQHLNGRVLWGRNAGHTQCNGHKQDRILQERGAAKGSSGCPTHCDLAYIMINQSSPVCSPVPHTSCSCLR